MKNISSLRTAGNLQLENNSGEDAATQRATAKVRRDMMKLQKELDNEKEANNNLQQRLARALKQRKEKDDEEDLEKKYSVSKKSSTIRK